MYIEQLVLHPVKVRISYEHTPMPKDHVDDLFSSPEHVWLKLVRDMVSLEDAPVRLPSFVVEGALESPQSLTGRLGAFYVDQLQARVGLIAGQLLGSLRLIGRPVGLLRNIGRGAKDFLYEVLLRLLCSSVCMVVTHSLTDSCACSRTRA